MPPRDVFPCGVRERGVAFGRGVPLVDVIVVLGCTGGVVGSGVRALLAGRGMYMLSSSDVVSSTTFWF